MTMAPGRDVVVVHTSDLHLDHPPPANEADGTAPLGRVLDAARHANADVVVMAGDTFESHRLPDRLVERAGELIAAISIPVVILPGNHDPAIPEAVFGKLSAAHSIHILGVTHDTVTLPDLALEIWGNPHRDYADMNPFGTFRPRTSRWQIAVAHGHYMPTPDRTLVPRPAWLIGDADIAATGADYVALGHWNRAARVGDGAVPAYYSGSPDYAKSVNVVRLAADGKVIVVREPL
jgi:DNA repair exonuclease SbcCD nuclease subunit